jgi:ATP-dependent RNA helicase DHX57
MSIDLPKNFLSPTYNPNMTTISHTTKTLGQDWLIQRMSAMGFPPTLCFTALEEAHGDESKALQILLQRLIDEDDLQEPPNASDIPAEELETIKQDEILALEAIYDNRVKVRKENAYVAYDIDIKPTGDEDLPTNGHKIILEIQIPQGSIYPYEIPIFIIHCDGLPSYIKLACMKKVMYEAIANLNMPMIYMCIEFLTDNILDLIQNPPKLRDVTEAFVSAPVKKDKKKTNKYQTSQKSRKMPEKELNKLSKELADKLEEMHLTSQYQDIGQVRNNLPAYSYQEQILNAVSKHQVTIVCGETGCGKTTQVPQFILDEQIRSKNGAKCNIICTQPRRISAMGVAGKYYKKRILSS